MRVAFAPSPVWGGLVLAVHLLAIGGAWLALPALSAAIVSAGLACSAWVGTGMALVRGRWAVREVELRADGSAAYVDARGEWRPAIVAEAVCLGHHFAAMRLRAGPERRSIVLVPGALDEGSFRRARVWARWRRPLGG